MSSIGDRPSDPFLRAYKPTLYNSSADCSALIAMIEKDLRCTNVALVVVFRRGQDNGSVVEGRNRDFVAD